LKLAVNKAKHLKNENEGVEHWQSTSGNTKAREHERRNQPTMNRGLNYGGRPFILKKEINPKT